MRKIAVFTGNRAEYGLLLPILKVISKRKDLKCFLIVAGAHLEKGARESLSGIKRDGLKVYRKVRIGAAHDSLFSTAVAIGTGVVGVSKALNGAKPDVLLVYGDRFEAFAATIAASQMGIPTAHVEGGDVTEGGALDDSVRHAMTKLSHIHFATNADSARRLIRLGEEPWRVFNVGFPAIDRIVAGNYASRTELEKKYGLDFKRPIVVFTQHSVATESDRSVSQLKPSLRALEVLAKEGCQIVVTYPNNDAGGRRIVDALKVWMRKKINGVRLVPCLGGYDYHGILYHGGFGGGRAVCVGNSSSGIKETPALGCPAVNIGSRQNGRLRAANVLDVSGYDSGKILKAVRKALFDDKFRKKCRTCSNPYGVGDAGKKIAVCLAKIPLGPELIKKKMTF